MRSFFLLLFGIAASISSASGQNWNSWKTDDTFRGIEVRTRCAGYNEFAGRYLWDVQLRNRYQKSVDVIWAAEPQRLHGAGAQNGRALGVSPGEIIDGRHTASIDCSSGLMVRVNEVRPADGRPAADAPRTTAEARPPQPKPQIQGHWTSRDPQEFQKSFNVQVYSDAVTSQWSSPGFSFEITTPLPKNVHGSVSIDPPAQK